MYMDVGLDTGDMILKESIDIGENETAGELHDRLAKLGGEVLGETLTKIKSGTAPRVKQDDHQFSYAPMLNKALGMINWHKTADEIHNLIRGTIPWPMAYTTYLGNIMKIWKSTVEKNNKQYKPGEVVDITKDKIYVATGKDLLIIEKLQFSGGKPLEVKQYLVGNTIDKQVVLGE